MQGRLLPIVAGRLQAFPGSRWREEFDVAVRLGLASIEWIYEEPTESCNPLGTGRIADIQEVSGSTGIRVSPICADYFIDCPWFKADTRRRRELSGKLIWLVECAAALGSTYVDVPFLDNSSLGESRRFAEVRQFIEPALEVAHGCSVLICLETDLGPEKFRCLLDSLEHPAMGVCYDSGNSASLGHDIRQEFQAYGNRIRTVHIKDRLRGGGTVPLGTGDADFATLFEQLENVSYTGPLILQAARGDDYLEAAKRSLEFVNQYVTPDGSRC